MIGYGDMFIQNATKPIQSTFIIKFQKAKKEAWLAKQKRLCIVINNCLGYNNYEVIKNLNIITKIITKIE